MHTGDVARHDGVDRENPAARNGTAREGDVQHPGQRDVVDELAPPVSRRGSSLRRTRWPM
jgi:hypothetical protein